MRFYQDNSKISDGTKLIIAIIVFVLIVLTIAAILKAIGFITIPWAETMLIAFVISIGIIFFMTIMGGFLWLIFAGFFGL